MNANLNPMAGGGIHRLSETTVRLAEKYLTGGFRARLKEFESGGQTPPFPANSDILFMQVENVRRLARESRLEIVPEERLAGAAPHLEALRHCIPGMNGVSSISHTTVDFGDAVRKGLSGLEREIAGRVKKESDPEKRRFLDALLDVIASMRIWIKRYVSEYRSRLKSETNPERVSVYRSILSNLERVPENPPETFAQAVQSFWSFFEFQRLCGNWSGLGRFDWILGGYLERDLEHGVITLDEARELVAHFWIKGTEWCYGLRDGSPFRPGSGDAQTYQNIILGGLTPGGKIVENAVTHLVLDVIGELHISDYPVTVRIGGRTSEKLLRRIAEVQLLGGGIVSVYNEDIVMEGLRRFGYPEKEVPAFTNDGCWEILIPGKTMFGYWPFDALAVFQKALFAEKTPENFEELYEAWLTRLKDTVQEFRRQVLTQFYRAEPDPVSGKVSFHRKSGAPDAVLSLLMPSCRRTARSYRNFGARYVVKAIHAGGLPDVANSLYAIRKFVYEEKRISLEELAGILRDDWMGHEKLRLELATRLFYYGNDDPGADAMMKRVFEDYARIAGRRKRVREVLTPVGISTFGREIQFAPNRFATAFGKHAHEYLASNLSPTPGTDRKPLSAVLNSYCKMDFTLTPNGCPLDIRLSAGIRKVPDAAGILCRMLRVFLEKGGFYLQVDTVDPEMLKAAKKDPDRFPNLVVRISGWSARFASLSEEWQDMIIRRTALETL